jgi:hypothetical protein
LALERLYGNSREYARPDLEGSFIALSIKMLAAQWTFQLRWGGGTKRRLAAWLGVILLAAIAGSISVYWYAVSVLDSALSFLKP